MPNTAGITFTGSFAAGMHIYRSMANGRYPRPCIAEMGGKNACVVTANADLDRAAAGIVRSAYGLSGQKCSALSRIYVDDSVADALIEKLQRTIAALTIGDPTRSGKLDGAGDDRATPCKTTSATVNSCGKTAGAFFAAASV